MKKAWGSLATQASVTRSEDMLQSLPFLTVSVYSFSIIFHGVLISLVGECYVCSFFVILSFNHLAMLCMVSHVRLRLSKILNTARFPRTNLNLINCFLPVRSEIRFVLHDKCSFFHVYYFENNCSSLGMVCTWTLMV